jgi:DNA-binding CsgD family transcriptional regulator
LTRLLGDTFGGGSPINTDDILNTASRAIAQRLPVTCMAILMKSDPDTSRVVLADQHHPAFVRWVDEYIASLLRPHEAPTTGLSQKVIETGGPIFIPCMSRDGLRTMTSDWGQTYETTHPMPAPANELGLLMVPMRSGPSVVGTLAIFDWGCQQLLGDADLDWMQRAGDRIGITVENARMRNKAVERNERIAAMSDVALAISSGQELRVTFNLILERVAATLRVDAADILLVEEDESAVTVAATTGFRSGFSAEAHGHVPSAAGKQWVIQHNIAAPSEIDWIGQTRRWMLSREGLRSYTAAPLMVRERFAGALEVFSRAEMEPDQEWLGFLDAMAATAAIALELAAGRESQHATLGKKPARRLAAPVLSERELQILRILVDGASNREVAERLHLSQNTIKFHVRQLLEKAEVANRTELATRAMHNGWV